MPTKCLLRGEAVFIERSCCRQNRTAFGRAARHILFQLIYTYRYDYQDVSPLRYAEIRAKCRDTRCLNCLWSTTVFTSVFFFFFSLCATHSLRSDIITSLENILRYFFSERCEISRRKIHVELSDIGSACLAEKIRREKFHKDTYKFLPV